jgi:hypothetical protein
MVNRPSRSSVSSEQEFLAWSDEWAIARARAWRGPGVILGVGVLATLLGPFALDRLLPGLWIAAAMLVLAVATMIPFFWLANRNIQRLLLVFGKDCSHCQTVIDDSDAVVKNRGRCTSCNGELYVPAT